MLRSVFLGIALCTTALVAAAQNPPSSQPNQQGTSPATGQPPSVPAQPEDTNGTAPAPPTFAPGAGGASAGDTLQNAPKVVRVSGGIMAGQVVHRIMPDNICAIERKEGVSGSVVLAVRVGKDGRISNVAGISGSPVLQRAWMDAVKQWTYKPYMLNGAPVVVETTVTGNVQCSGEPDAAPHH